MNDMEVGRVTITRREGQSVMFDDDIRVTVGHIGGGRVRLQIVAPLSVRILRQEIYGTNQEDAPAASVDRSGNGS